MIEATAIFPYRMKLGECPTWSATEQALYWIDIPGDGLFCRDWKTGRTRHWPMPATIGSFGLFKDGTLLLALRSGFVRFDPNSGASTPIGPSPDYDQSFCRYNDGRADRQGCFWVGSMNERRSGPDGKLYRFDPKTGRLETKLEGVTISNGLAFSPDDRTLYFADTVQKTIWAFDFDIARGSLLNRRIFVQLDDAMGRPDGAAVDAQGGYWIALIGKVARFLPNGALDRIVELPVERVTMCAFGGADLSTLIITSSSENLGSDWRETQPQAGFVLALDVGARGIAEPYL
jgi:L-arabinonolactonase